MGRSPCCEKVGLRRGRWTAEEDEKLKHYVLTNGEGSWKSLPKNAGLLRCGKSCRLRWVNYLRSDLKSVDSILLCRQAVLAGKIPVGSQECPVQPLDAVDVLAVRIKNINLNTSDRDIHRICKSLGDLVGLARMSKDSAHYLT